MYRCQSLLLTGEMTCQNMMPIKATTNPFDRNGKLGEEGFLLEVAAIPAPPLRVLTVPLFLPSDHHHHLGEVAHFLAQEVGVRSLAIPPALSHL